MSLRADEARQLAADGYTLPEISERMGVKLPWVRELLHYDRYRATRLKNLAVNRRRRDQAQYECGVCGKLGHNARRHSEEERDAARENR